MTNKFISSKPTREKVFRVAVWARISDWLEDELGYSDDKAMDTASKIWDGIKEDIDEWEAHFQQEEKRNSQFSKN